MPGRGKNQAPIRPCVVALHHARILMGSGDFPQHDKRYHRTSPKWIFTMGWRIYLSGFTTVQMLKILWLSHSYYGEINGYFVFLSLSDARSELFRARDEKKTLKQNSKDRNVLVDSKFQPKILYFFR